VRKSEKKISNESTHFFKEDIVNLNITERFLERNFVNKKTQNIFLSRLCLIQNQRKCEECGNLNDMSYVKRKSALDGFIWTCDKSCRKSHCLRKNSFFEGCRLDILLIFKIIYKYINKNSYSQISRDLEINRNTVSDYAEKVREIICEYIFQNNQQIGGLHENGEPKIVEIDESLFFKRKYDRGRVVEGQWYVGGVEKGTKNAFLVPVFDRSAQTMARVIYENVLPGSIIMTDEWKAYDRAMRDMPEYLHYTVNHSINFVNPYDSNIHTQTIEGFWSLAKRYLRERNGICQDQHEDFLIQFIWEHKIP
ncbi:hypothetical protein DMUE_6132, partial [Dictyocoela muelleri]